MSKNMDKKVKAVCFHRWQKQTTIWPGIEDKVCSKCGYVDATTLPDSIYKKYSAKFCGNKESL